MNKRYKNSWKELFKNRTVMSWCLFDWANSSFPTNVITFIFAAYFIQFVAENPIIGTGQWGLMQSFAALFVAFLSPILGAFSDVSGYRKVLLMISSCFCIIFTIINW